MSNTFTAVANVGRDPEEFTTPSGAVLTRVRCATEAAGKKQVTRWFTATFTGHHGTRAKGLAKGDQILVSGQLGLIEYKNKKSGEMVREDEMPYATLVRVLKSESLQKGDGGEDQPAPATSAPAAGSSDQDDFINSL